MEKSVSDRKGIDPMLVLGKAVDMGISVNGGDFSVRSVADEDAEDCT